MEIRITTRHNEQFPEKQQLTDELRKYAEDKVLRLKRYLDRIHNVELVLEGEADKIKTHLRISVVRGQKFEIAETGSDLRSTIDTVVEKMERQLVRFKEKLKGKDRKSSGRMRAIKEGLAAPGPDELEDA